MEAYGATGLSMVSGGDWNIASGSSMNFASSVIPSETITQTGGNVDVNGWPQIQTHTKFLVSGSTFSINTGGVFAACALVNSGTGSMGVAGTGVIVVNGGTFSFALTGPGGTDLPLTPWAMALQEVPISS